MNKEVNLLDQRAREVLEGNDKGGYTIPTAGLYPYQWNWDSGFTALGIWHFNKWRAWLEIMALLDAQWEDGMIPHIVFRQNDPDYFPGPMIWQTNTEPPSSGHSQPPVLASVILKLVEGRDRDHSSLGVGPRQLSRLGHWHGQHRGACRPDAL